MARDIDGEVNEQLQVERCDDVVALFGGDVEGLRLSARSKGVLDAAIVDVISEGWRVAVRSHCSETGRHAANLFRPLTGAAADEKGRAVRRAKARVRAPRAK